MKIGNEVETDRDKIVKEVMNFFEPLFEGRHVSGGAVSDTTFCQDDTLLKYFLSQTKYILGEVLR